MSAGAAHSACAITNAGTPFELRKAFFASTDVDGLTAMKAHAWGTDIVPDGAEDADGVATAAPPRPS